MPFGCDHRRGAVSSRLHWLCKVFDDLSVIDVFTERLTDRGWIAGPAIGRNLRNIRNDAACQIVHEGIGNFAGAFAEGVERNQAGVRVEHHPKELVADGVIGGFFGPDHRLFLFAERPDFIRLDVTQLQAALAIRALEPQNGYETASI